MKRLMTLSVAFTLVACSGPEGKIKAATGKIEMAQALVKENPLNNKAMDLIQDAESITRDLEAEPLYATGKKVCSQLQLPFDAENLTLRIKTIRYVIEFANSEKYFAEVSSKHIQDENDPVNYLYLYGLYHDHEDDGAKMLSGKEIAKECQSLGMAVTYKKEYDAALAEHDEISKKIAGLYEKKTGIKFSDTISNQNHLQSARRHAKTWDELSSTEKMKAAKGNAEVEKCLNSALSENKSTDGVDNIIQDTAKLCSGVL